LDKKECVVVDPKKVDKPLGIDIPKSSLLYKLPIVFLVAGILCLVYWATFYQDEPGRSMYSYLFSFIVMLSLALGAMAFVLIQHVTRAGWSVAVRRVPETLISLMPLYVLLFIPIAWWLHDIFPWTHAEHIDAILEKKALYLNEEFFLIRSFGYLLSWAVMGVWFYRVSVAQDEGGKFSLTKNMQAVSAPAIIIFGLTLTFASFDWVMSLQPHWYSTIFGVYFFAGSILFALAFITLFCLILQKAGLLKGVITGEHYHDLGKLMFGFTVFWAYIAFSQFMLYWYGNIPEEIEFYAHRLHHGWEVVSWALPVIHFFIPFFGLMSRALKRVKLVLIVNCLWVMTVHIVDLYWIIMPAYQDPTVAEGPPHLHISLTDLLAFFGMSALVIGSFLFVLSRRKILAAGDPRLRESLAFENF
jgi:hypothetical protein